jgi:transposase
MTELRPELVTEPIRHQDRRRGTRDRFWNAVTIERFELVVLDEGKKVAEVARDLDLTPSALGGWVNQARADRDGGKSGLTSDERAELVRLRKELRVAKMERDILGKAVVHSSRKHRGRVHGRPGVASCGRHRRKESTRLDEIGSVATA